MENGPESSEQAATMVVVFVPPPFHPRRPDLVAPVRVDEAGRSGPTRAQAAGPRWRRSSRGFYVPAATPREHPEQRCVEAAAVLHAGGAVTGWAALRWQGAHWFAGLHDDGSTPRPVPLVVCRFLRSQPGLLITEEFAHPDHVREVEGLPVTDPLWSVSFEMRHATSLRAAVTVADMAMYADLVSLAELQEYVRTLHAPTGVPQMRTALLLAEENAWSPAEVSMRLTWLSAGHSLPLCNVPVFDLAGRFLGTPDLIDPEHGVMGEYDGGLHLTGSRRAGDLEREARFRRHGLETATMVAADLTDPTRFLGRLRDAYDRAARPGRTCSWTLAKPAWWIPTETVDQRRGLTLAERRRLLRHRLAS